MNTYYWYRLSALLLARLFFRTMGATTLPLSRRNASHDLSTRYADEYIADAPENSNRASDLKWQRRHATRKTKADQLKGYAADVAGTKTDYYNPTRFKTAGNPSGSLYSRQLPTDDENFLKHSRKSDRMRSVFEYRPEVIKIANDRRFSYVILCCGCE